MGIVLANNAKTTLAANVSSIDTTFYVDDIDGFPALDVGDYFYCTIESTTGAYEIVKVTQINATNFLVERGQEGTIAVPFNIGARVELRMTVQNLEDQFVAAVEDTVDTAVAAAIPTYISDTAYGVGWDGNFTVPTKNAVYDKIQTITGLSDGDKGDITVSSSGATWTIDNNTVTLAKMATMATSSFLGRITGSTGNVEVLSAANAKTILALAQADISGLTTASSPTFTGLTLSSALSTSASIDVTGGTLQSSNGFHAYFTSNTSYLRSLQNGVAWRDLVIDGASTYINVASLGGVYMNGSSATVDYSSNGPSAFFVGGANAQPSSISIRANAGKSRGLGFYTGASSTRWYMECESTAESGANAGSNFALSSWTDAGAYLGTPFYIARATGVASFSARPVFNGNTALDTGNGAQLGVANSFTANQTITGALSATTIQGPPPVSSETTGTLTSASRNKIVQCSGGVTLPSSGMTDGDSILIDPRGTARTITRPAAHTMYIANTDSATGTTGAHNVVTAVYHGSSKWTLQGSVT